MTHEVGIRELHDKLSRYVRLVAQGDEVIVTMRGRHVARLTPVDSGDPWADLRARGILSEPTGTWQPRPDRPAPTAPVSELVAEQRR